MDLGAAEAIRNKFMDFLERDLSGGYSYKERVEFMISRGRSRLILRIDDLREFDSELARKFQLHPNDYLPFFEDTLVSYIQREYGSKLQSVAMNMASVLEDTAIDSDSDSDGEMSDAPSLARQPLTLDDIHIGITGNMGTFQVSPRHLMSHFIGRLVCVEGIVTKCSVVLPKVVRTVHYCPSTQQFLKKDYRDFTSVGGLPTGFQYPTRDRNGNPLQTEFGLSRFKDTQSLFVQEMPERAPPGQLPRSVECLLEQDLVDRVKPGDRVRMIGVYRALAGRGANYTTGTMRTALIVNNIETIGQQIQQPTMSEIDIANFKKFSEKHSVGEILARSIAPTIYGHEQVKKALLLLLFGGMEKNFANGTHIRGDINILMVGDPSTAKSQLLRFMLHISPLSVSTTGRASTGVGLTAAVVSDRDTGERSLQAGAMVLADRGIVCVDEFDKMSDIDRVAMHEVMEQQTVTIAKAGIHATLNARCSVIAAANPIYGQYNRQIRIQRNVGLPDSLLSRFDLVFVMLDERDPRRDRDIAGHVLNFHRQRSAQDSQMSDSERVESANTNDRDNEEDIEESKRLYQWLNTPHQHDDRVYPINFLRKYLHFAKSRIKPEMTAETTELISLRYCELRKNAKQKTLPITPRTLETLIRLSTAHAKCRLSNYVEEIDVNEAFALMEFAIFFMNGTSAGDGKASATNSEGLRLDTASTDNSHTQTRKGTKRKRENNTSAMEEGEEDDDTSQRSRPSVRRTRRTDYRNFEVYEEDPDDDLDMSRTSQAETPVETEEERGLSSTQRNIARYNHDDDGDDVDEDMVDSDDENQSNVHGKVPGAQPSDEIAELVRGALQGLLQSNSVSSRSELFSVTQREIGHITEDEVDAVLDEMLREGIIMLEGDNIYIC